MSRSFFEARQWNQGIAFLRADILERRSHYVSLHQDRLGITKAQQRYVELFNSGLIDKDLSEKLRDKKVSKDKLYRWQKAFETQGLPGLLDGYGNGGSRITPEIREAIERLVWENLLVRYRDIHDALSIQFENEKLPSYYTVRNYARPYREEYWPALVLKHEGLKGLRDRGMDVALGRKDADLTEPNQRWEIDTTVADLFTKREVKDVVLRTSEGKRCKVIGIIDVFSRAMRFYLVEQETSLMVGQAIRDRILAWGVPGELVIDNGRSYKNRRVLTFLRSIGVAVHICIPGNPVEKPHIERAFRTLTEKFFRRLPGYSGNSVQNRPNEIEIKYTKSKLQEIMDRYVTSVYAETVHSTTGQRPRERMSPQGFTPKTISERTLDILLMEEHSRIVRQGYIAYLGGRYFHKKLPEGRKVKFRVNDFDVSELLVFVDRKFLCGAEDYRRSGKTPNEFIEARKGRNRELRTRIKAHEALVNKPQSNKPEIISLIQHYENRKPVELQKKADLLQFPGLEGIQYNTPETDENQSRVTPPGHNDEDQGEKLITNEKEKYLHIMRRERRGESITERDKNFLDKFRQSNAYQMIGSYLNEQLDREAVNEG